MESKELIKINLEMGFGMISQLVEDMKDVATVFPTEKGGCHALYLIGHFAYAHGTLLQQFMLGEENPLTEWKELFGDGAEPSADASIYPPFDEVMAMLRETHSKNLAYLDTLTEEDLDKPSKDCPPEFESFIGTVRLCFNTIAAHYYMHRGQLADVRRVAGLPRMGP